MNKNSAKKINSDSSPKRNFLAAATHVIPFVSLFGENFVAHLVSGDVVSYTEEFCEVADVFNWATYTAFQVKMCNSRHAQRPTAGQVSRLHKETRRNDKPFVAEIHHGLYAFVFYDGIKRDKEHRGKSKLLSRKNNRGAKFEIIANEIQYVYLVEVDLLQYISKSNAFTDVQKFGSSKVHAKHKVLHYQDRLVLYLTRSFFQGFVNDLPRRLQKALNSSFGKGLWCIEQKVSEVEFKKSKVFKRKIPIIFIGRSKTFDGIKINSRVLFNLNDLKI